MALAQAFLTEPLMFNHSRGLWGYTGIAADGLPLTVQSTGIGAASASIVLEELVVLGLARAIRIGTCAALADGLRLGELLIAESAFGSDGASRLLLSAADARVCGDAGLTAGLRSAGPAVRAGRVASTDLHYDARHADARYAGPHDGAAWRTAGVLAVELETASLFALAARRGIPIASILVVCDAAGPGGSWCSIDDEAATAACERAGRLAVAALG